jgi:uncharacterized protein
VKFLRNYNIDIIKLKDAKHSFQFEVGDVFFNYFKADDWVKGSKITVNVTLNKTSAVIEAYFEFSGTVRLTCDRSLEEFDHPLEFTEKVIYKYGPAEQEISEDVFMITRDSPTINIAQLIYEFILLSIPAKKIHPDYVEEMEDDDFEEEGYLVYLSDELDSEKNEELEEEEDNSEKPVDPRWDILNKLKKKD